MSIHYKALSLCAAVAMTTVSLLAVAPVQAQTTVVTGQRVSDLPTKLVSFADLNLAGAADQAMLERRVGYAVKQVCQERGQNAEKNLGSFTRYNACRDFAWDGARPQLAAAVDRARALALNGNGSVAVGSLAITISAPSGL